jgi:hypothetical protein
MFTCDEKLDTRLMQEPSKNKTKQKATWGEVVLRPLIEPVLSYQPRLSDPVLSPFQYTYSRMMALLSLLEWLN